VLLRGKALEVLKALAKAPGQVLTLDNLRKDVWGNTVVGEEAVRQQLHKARNALRTAMRAASVNSPDDPIPTVDRGDTAVPGKHRTAWRLNLA
jgi:DNA-binding winged helix-turn-helix (wHTH) protein